MSSDPTPAIRAEAISWHIRLREDRADDWVAFTDWLERDPRHSNAYDAIALADAQLAPVFDEWSRLPVALTNDNRPIRKPTEASRRWMIGGLGAAAAAAGLLFVLPMVSPQADYYDVTTTPGEQRIVTLAGRDRIALNGETRIRLDRNNSRFASLTRGEAAFTIVHDPKSPFILLLGDNRVEDVGTAFNVIRDSSGHRVEVSEGSILYNPKGERIALTAGQTLTSKTKERRVVLMRKPASEIGGWQQGRLSYRSERLAVVAADLARNLGTTIAIEPAIAGRSFTGTIEIDRNESRMFARLAQLLDVDVRRGPVGWTFGSKGKSTG